MGGSSSGARDRVGIYDASGVFQRTVRRIIRVVGPASYTTTEVVDASAYFSSIVHVVALRVFATSGGGIQSDRVVAVGEGTGALYSAGKFTYRTQRPPAHTHTYDKTNTPTATPSGNPTGFGADNAHTHALTYTSTASGAATSTLMAQDGAGTNLSALTFEFLVEGIPL